jgi:hypothetical protein
MPTTNRQTQNVHSRATMMKKLMSNGVSFEDAYNVTHPAALQKYDVSNFGLYAPEVIKEFPAQFGTGWWKYWNIVP